MLLIDLDPFTLLQLEHEFLQARDKYGISVIISNDRREIVYHSEAASGRITWEQVLHSEFDLTGDRAHENRIILSEHTAQGELFIKTEIPAPNCCRKSIR